MINIFQFCLFVSCLVTILAKSSTNIMSTMISIGIRTNSNQTADIYRTRSDTRADCNLVLHGGMQTLIR